MLLLFLGRQLGLSHVQTSGPAPPHSSFPFLPDLHSTNPVQSGSIRFNPVQSGSIQFNPVQSGSIPVQFATSADLNIINRSVKYFNLNSFKNRTGRGIACASQRRLAASASTKSFASELTGGVLVVFPPPLVLAPPGRCRLTPNYTQNSIKIPKYP